MNHTARATLAVALGLIALVAGGCGGPVATDADEVGRWLGEQSRADVDGAVGSMGGLTEPADPPPSPSEGITMWFERPVRIDAVRVSCLAGALSFSVEVSEATGSVTQSYPDVECAANEQDLALSASDVTSVKINGFGADRGGAWHAVILGSEE